MAESTEIECIDNLVLDIEKSTGLRLTRVPKNREEKTGGGPGYPKYIREIFKYNSGRDKTERIGIAYQALSGGMKQCELHLIDVEEGDLRVQAYFKDTKDQIKPPEVRMPSMGGAIKLSLDEGDILNAYRLNSVGLTTMEINFKHRQSNLALMEGTRNLPTWAATWTKFYTVSGVEKGLNYSQKEFISYVMKSKAK